MFEIDMAISVWELVKHAGSWLTNLRRAKNSRKTASIAALRKVILAARQTSVYIRHLQLAAARDPQTETHIAMLWTELGFALEDLGVVKLANRCNATGKQWTQADLTGEPQLTRIAIGLEKIEQSATQLLNHIDAEK